MGDSQILGTWTHAEGKLHIFGLELKAVILALWVTILWATKLWSLPYRHTGPDPFPHPVTSSSGSVPMATDSRHSHKDQTHFGLSDSCEPSVSTKSANINQIRSLHPETLNRIFRTWELQVCHSPQHASSPVYIFNSGALMLCKTDREVDVQVTKIPLLNTSFRTKDQTGGSGTSNSPLVTISTMVPTSTTSVFGPCIILYHRNLLSQQGHVSDGLSYHLHGWRHSCRTTKQQDFQRGL